MLHLCCIIITPITAVCLSYLDETPFSHWDSKDKRKNETQPLGNFRHLDCEKEPTPESYILSASIKHNVGGVNVRGGCEVGSQKAKPVSGVTGYGSEHRVEGAGSTCRLPGKVHGTMMGELFGALHTQWLRNHLQEGIRAKERVKGHNINRQECCNQLFENVQSLSTESLPVVFLINKWWGLRYLSIV